MAVNCRVVPIAKLAGLGVTEIDLSTLAVTVNVAVPLTPLRVAVTALEPAATAVAIPDELIVATAVFADVQLAVALTFAVEASLYVAVAVNCVVAPTAKLTVLGDGEIDVTVFCGVVNTELPHPMLARISDRGIERNNH